MCVKHLQEHFQVEQEAKKDCRLISLILMRKLPLWWKQEKPDMAVDPVNQMVILLTRLEGGWGQEWGTHDPHQTTLTCRIGCHRHHHRAEETGMTPDLKELSCPVYKIHFRCWPCTGSPSPRSFAALSFVTLHITWRHDMLIYFSPFPTMFYGISPWFLYLQARMYKFFNLAHSVVTSTCSKGKHTHFY